MSAHVISRRAFLCWPGENHGLSLFLNLAKVTRRLERFIFDTKLFLFHLMNILSDCGPILTNFGLCHLSIWGQQIIRFWRFFIKIIDLTEAGLPIRWKSSSLALWDSFVSTHVIDNQRFTEKGRCVIIWTSYRLHLMVFLTLQHRHQRVL